MKLIIFVFLYILTTRILYGSNFITYKFCNSPDFTISFDAVFYCHGKPFQLVVLYLKRCLGNKTTCSTIDPHIRPDNKGQVTYFKVFNNPKIHFNVTLFVHHFCFPANVDTFKLDIEDKYIACGNEVCGLKSFGTIELNDTKYNSYPGSGIMGKKKREKIREYLNMTEEEDPRFKASKKQNNHKIENKYIVHEYLGIPYAKPPTGSRRFNPPEKITPPTKNKKFKVNKGATACPQDNIFKATIPDLYVSNVYPTNISEDCLQLNMWVPEIKSGAVIVHFVGDSYSTLSASHDIYNGSVLAAFSKAIVVNVNFRLGAFGFAKVNSINISGNMGLLDQQMALKWVYNNVELFGGKKTKITLLGVQAGSSSVQAHLYSKASSKYFSRIALISGVLENTWASRTSLFTKKLSRKLVKSLQCDKQVEDKINCLRNKTVYEIINQSYALRRSLHSTFGFSFALTRRDGKPSDKWKPYDSSTEKIMLLNDKYNKDSMTKYIPLLYKNCYWLVKPFEDDILEKLIEV
uniref:COesterase domain-containing protein n=1 Tax=Parastrongyloides trichosuri TaxID=131310 RepID=A0A0N4ZKV9_PARTI